MMDPRLAAALALTYHGVKLGAVYVIGLAWLESDGETVPCVAVEVRQDLTGP